MKNKVLLVVFALVAVSLAFGTHAALAKKMEVKKMTEEAVAPVEAVTGDAVTAAEEAVAPIEGAAEEAAEEVKAEAEDAMDLGEDYMEKTEEPVKAQM